MEKLKAGKKRERKGGERKKGINPKTGRPYAQRQSGMVQAECFFKDGEAEQTQNGLMARSAEGHEGRHVPLSDHQQRQTDRREHFGRGVCLSKMDDIEHKSVA